MTPVAELTARPSEKPHTVVPGRPTVPGPGAQTTAAARTRLLLEGPVVSTLLRLAAPNAIVNVVLIAVTASVDAHFVGRLGPGALAGLALVFPLMMLMQQMANGSMGSAIASAVARALGAGRRDDAAALVVHGLVIGGGMAVIFSSVLLIAGPTLYALMGGTGSTLVAAVEYSNVIFAGALTYWLLSALTSVLRGAGQVFVLAVVYLGAEVLHIILVPLFVFGLGPVPALGITGAGLATVTSFTVSTVFLAWYLVSGRTPVSLSLRTVRLDRRLFRDILRVGAPMSLQPILNNLTLVTLTAFVATLGPTALAGFGVAVRLEYVQVPLTFGLGAGLLAMVGTSIGAGQLARATRVAWTAAALGASATGLFGLIAATWPGAWTGFFTAAPAVQLAAASYLCLVGFTYPFVGFGLTLSSAFQAAGRPLWPLLATASRALIVAVGGGIVVHATDTGLVGIGIVVAGGMIVYGSVLGVRFRAGAWKRTGGPRQHGVTFSSACSNRYSEESVRSAVNGSDRWTVRGSLDGDSSGHLRRSSRPHA
jgi:putative MATE family efflux protein